jgi:hypothetical protein
MRGSVLCLSIIYFPLPNWVGKAAGAAAGSQLAVNGQSVSTQLVGTKKQVVDLIRRHWIPNTGIRGRRRDIGP